MSAITNRVRLVPRASLSATQRMAFRASAMRPAGKESKLHENDRHLEIERHKQDSLKKSRMGAGQWKDELASDSESIIKADRGEIEASEETFKKLQMATDKVAGKGK